MSVRDKNGYKNINIILGSIYKNLKLNMSQCVYI